MRWLPGGARRNNQRKRAVEMPGLWKAWKAKTGFPLFPPAPWKSRQKAARFPHSHGSGHEGDGKVENQKQVSHFPTAVYGSSFRT